jgi:predicted transcriptional regulator
MNPKKNRIKTVRIDDDLAARVAAITAAYGVAEAVLFRDALDAVCTYIEENEGYRRPIDVIRAGELRAVAQLAAEPPGKYLAGAGEKRRMPQIERGKSKPGVE